MTRRSALPLLSLLLTVAPVNAGPAVPATATPGSAAGPRVILISIDGLRPKTYLDPAAHGVELPHLQALMKRGAYAEAVEGVFPTVTYPSHTTLITGVRSATHGIFGNSYFQPDKAGPADWYWHTAAIRVPTLWHVAQQAGLTVANLSWPVSVGCPCDWNIPEIWDNSSPAQPDTMRILREHTVPPDLIDRIGADTEPWTDENYNINTLTRDLLAAQAAAWMIEEFRPHFFTIHLMEYDHFAHGEGPDGPQALQALEYADAAVGMIVEAVERAGLADDITIVVTGDHGFAAVERQVRPNEWLAEGGYLTVAEGKITGWRAQFFTSGAAAALLLRDVGDVELAAEIQADFERRLGAIPEADRPFDILTRQELDELEAFPVSPFGLALRPGWNVSKKVGAGFSGSDDGGTHGYPPSMPAMHAGLILAGRGIDPDGHAEQVSMVDIAPTIAALLGVELTQADGEPFVWALLPETVGAAGR
ncbi:MAG TPA: alkaline phosphatase family protein [bacterium]|nr:alkaline phosphatase family protein [bacterium]